MQKGEPLVKVASATNTRPEQSSGTTTTPWLPNDHRCFSPLRLYAGWSLVARANQMDIHKIPLPNVRSEFQALASKVLFAGSWRLVNSLRIVFDA